VLPPGVYARTAIYTQACNSECYGYASDCNSACSNGTAMYHAAITLNSSLINTAASTLGISSYYVAKANIAHELGHTLALDDVAILHGGCSEAGTIMIGLNFLCGTYGPSSLDTSVVDFIYPGAPGYCDPGANYCGSTGCL
jgi:hypothetical protein